MNGLVSTVAFTRSKKNSIDGIVPVTGNKNEPLSSSSLDPRYRPVKHFASDLRHHHVANNELEAVFHDLAQALAAAPNRGHLIRAGGQVVVENQPQIVAIFEQQNPRGRPGRLVRGNLNLERDHLRGNWIESW